MKTADLQAHYELVDRLFSQLFATFVVFWFMEFLRSLRKMLAFLGMFIENDLQTKTNCRKQTQKKGVWDTVVGAIPTAVFLCANSTWGLLLLCCERPCISNSTVYLGTAAHLLRSSHHVRIRLTHCSSHARSVPSGLTDDTEAVSHKLTLAVVTLEQCFSKWGLGGPSGVLERCSRGSPEKKKKKYYYLFILFF